MIVHLDIPPEIDDVLYHAWGKDFERNVLEAVAVELYRQRKCGSATVMRMLGLEDRWDTIEFLSKRNAYPNYNEEDLEEDRRNLEKVLGPPPKRQE